MMKRGGVLNIQRAQWALIAAILTPINSSTKKSSADFGPRTLTAFGAGTGVGCYLEVIPCKGNTISVDP
jgi:hypothetical protein